MKFFISLILLFTTLTIYTQDIIVINGNDTINCKITEVSAHQIHYKITNKKKEINKSFPITQVKFYEFNKTTTQKLNAKTIDEDKNKSTDYPKTRVYAGVGFGQLLAKVAPTVPAEYKQHVEDLKSGINFNSGASRFFGKYLGLSVDASFFKAKETFKDSIFIKNDFGDIYAKGIMEDDIKIIHFGASIIGRYLFGKKKEHGVYANLGLGWNFYENKYTFINLNHIKAKTYAISGYLGYDYKIFKNIAIGIGLDYKLASFSEATVNGIDRELDDNQFENISRQSIMIGIRYVR